MARKLCKLCHERPAEIPDRETYRGRWRKEVCSRCHAERLHGDLRQLLNRSVDAAAPKPWHCVKCGKRMQFADGLCWDCFGGDPGQ